MLPANEGRGYVLRRIMRRAMRHAHLLGAKEPLMYRLVPALVAEMGAAYPELVRAQPLIEATLQQEETRFRQTLVNGLKLLDEATAGLARGRHAGRRDRVQALRHLRLPLRPHRGRAARARAAGRPRRLRHRHGRAEGRRRARPGRAPARRRSDDIWFDLAEEHGATEFTGYSGDEGEGVVLAIVKDGERVENAEVGETVDVLLNQTPFYGESGGQIGDTGKLTTLKGFVGEVEDTSKPLGKLHVLRTKVVAGELSVGETVHQKVDAERRDRVRANHSATHLLHAALRRQLGTHVTQKGSLVAPDYFRFDFSHPKALTREEIDAVEAEVNAQIRSNEPVTTRLMTPDEAISAGAMALFGEKYGDEVRVLSMGRADATRDYSVELCGGTHVRALGDIQLLKIISRKRGLLRRSPDRGADRRSRAPMAQRPRRQAARGRGDAEELARRGAGAHRRAGRGAPAARARACRREEGAGDGRRRGQVRRRRARGGQRPQVPRPGRRRPRSQGLARRLLTTMKKRLGSGIAALVAVNDGRASVAVGVTDDLAGQVSAVDLVKAAVAALGGQGGGGRPDMAQGGGPDGSKAKKRSTRSRTRWRRSRLDRHDSRASRSPSTAPATAAR